MCVLFRDTGVWEYVLIDERKVESKNDLAAEFDSVNQSELARADIPPEEVSSVGAEHGCA